MRETQLLSGWEFYEVQLWDRKECGIPVSFARRVCATQTAGPGTCYRRTRPSLLPSRGGVNLPRVMAPVKNYTMRRAFESRQLRGNGLANVRLYGRDDLKTPKTNLG